MFAGLFISTALHAQVSEMPAIGTIDFFGLTMSEPEALEIVPFKVGDAMEAVARTMGFLDPDSQPLDFAAMFGAAHGSAQFVCCNEDGLTMAYIGLTNSEVPAVEYRDPPTAEVFLPEELIGRYKRSMEYLFEAVQQPQGSEDQPQGHLLVGYPPLREIQESFIVDARDKQALLIQVLHESVDPEQRSVAAHVLGYAPDKKAIVPELVLAVRDSNGAVRNNATRAIGEIAVYAVTNPQLGIEIDGDVFVDMLNSLDWTDRNKGLMVLHMVSRTRDDELLSALRTRTLSALIEMCAWKNLGHAEGACVILERILGLPEQDTLHPRASTLAQARALAAEP